MTIYYFAYGSNMSISQMRHRVSQVKEPIKARLLNYSLVFNKIASKHPGEGKANIRPEKDEFVEGVIYELSKEQLQDLDIDEGCAGKHYYREELEILKSDGTTIMAWTYIAYEHRINNSLKPTKEYLDRLLEGRKYLSEGYYKKLASTATL